MLCHINILVYYSIYTLFVELLTDIDANII